MSDGEKQWRDVKYQRSKLVWKQEANVVGILWHYRRHEGAPQVPNQVVVAQLEPNAALSFRSRPDYWHYRLRSCIRRRCGRRIRRRQWCLHLKALLLSLLKHQSAQTQPHQSLLSQVPRNALLQIQQQIKSVLKGVLCPSCHKLGDFRPLLGPLQFQNVLQQSPVFLGRPGSLVNGGVDEAVPVFSALFGSAEDLVFGGIAFVQAFRDQLPVDLILLSDGLGEELRLSLGPLVKDQSNLLEAQPAEFTFLPATSRDHGGYELPIAPCLNKKNLTSSEKWARPCCSMRLETLQTKSVMSSLFQFRLIFLFRSILHLQKQYLFKRRQASAIMQSSSLKRQSEMRSQYSSTHGGSVRMLSKGREDAKCLSLSTDRRSSSTFCSLLRDSSGLS